MNIKIENKDCTNKPLNLRNLLCLMTLNASVEYIAIRPIVYVNL